MGTTCYERDEIECEDPICVRTGCRLLGPAQQPSACAEAACQLILALNDMEISAYNAAKFRIGKAMALIQSGSLTPAEGEPVTELDFMNWFITAGCTGMSVAQTAAAILQKFDVRPK
jgi:hypothetical protein